MLPKTFGEIPQASASLALFAVVLELVEGSAVDAAAGAVASGAGVGVASLLDAAAGRTFRK